MKKNTVATFLISLLFIKNSHASEQEVFRFDEVAKDVQNEIIYFLDIPSRINLAKTCKEQNEIQNEIFKKDTKTIKSLLIQYAESEYKDREKIETILGKDNLFFNALKNQDTRSQFAEYLFGRRIKYVLSKKKLLQCFSVLESDELLPDLTNGIRHSFYNMIKFIVKNGYIYDLEFVNRFFNIIKERHSFVNHRRFIAALKHHFELPFFKKFGVKAQQHNWDKILPYIDLYYSYSKYEKTLEDDDDKDLLSYSYKDFINGYISGMISQKMLDEELSGFIEYAVDTLSKKSESAEAICCERVEEHSEPVHAHALMDNQNNQVVDSPTVTTSNLFLAIKIVEGFLYWISTR